MRPADPTEAEADLQWRLGLAKDELRRALLTGADTRPARAEIKRLSAERTAHARQAAQLRAQAEAAQAQGAAVAAEAIARVTMARVRTSLDALAAPPPPASFKPSGATPHDR